MNTFLNIDIPISMTIVLMKNKVVKRRSVRVYIAYINDFNILNTIIDSSGYSY